MSDSTKWTITRAVGLVSLLAFLYLVFTSPRSSAFNPAEVNKVLESIRAN